MSMFNTPSAPDPVQAAQYGQNIANSQTGMNVGAATTSQAGSEVNQNNQYGGLNYSQTGTGPGGVPIYTANVSLSQPQQQLFNQYQTTQGQAGQEGNTLLGTGDYGSGQSPASVIGDATSGNTAALVKEQTDYLNPFFTTQHDQLDTQLRNQGLAPGNPAYDNAMRGLQTNQGLTVSQAAAQFEPQAYQQATQNYELPLQLGENLAQFGQAGTPTSQLVQTPGLNIQPADLTGATATENNALNSTYQAQMAQNSAALSGLFGIPSAVLGGWAKSGGLSNLMGATSAAA